jgi:hypothetical protein
MAKVTAQYLTHYAEPETHIVDDLLDQLNQQQTVFQHVVVVPAYHENCRFLSQFITMAADIKVLFVVVVNQPETENDTTSQRELYKQIMQLGNCSWQKGPCAFIEFSASPCACLLVDRFNQPIPAQQGVGLARKIGSDLALAFISKNICTTTFIASTDADVSLPSNYFSSLAALKPTIAAATFNFSHQCTDISIHQANALYEQALRYYVAGLSYANSAYAFFTIGSILAINAKYYANVRGFPKRSAGEDFYLLNKLAKLGDIEFIEQTIIHIEARTSHRVPFGTGPAVKEIMQLQQDQKPYCYYHPDVFVQLKHVITQFSCLFDFRSNLSNWFERLPEKSALALTDIGFMQFVNKHQNDKPAQFNKQLHVWFDAFKTLRFIHQLRVHGLADMPLRHAIEQAPFTTNKL